MSLPSLCSPSSQSFPSVYLFILSFFSLIFFTLSLSVFFLFLTVVLCVLLRAASSHSTDVFPSYQTYSASYTPSWALCWHRLCPAQWSLSADDSAVAHEMRPRTFFSTLWLINLLGTFLCVPCWRRVSELRWTVCFLPKSTLVGLMRMFLVL